MNVLKGVAVTGHIFKPFRASRSHISCISRRFKSSPRHELTQTVCQALNAVGEEKK